MGESNSEESGMMFLILSRTGTLFIAGHDELGQSITGCVVAQCCDVRYMGLLADYHAGLHYQSISPGGIR